VLEGIFLVKVHCELHEGFKEGERVDYHVVDEKPFGRFVGGEHVAKDELEDLVVQEEEEEVEGEGPVVQSQRGGGRVDVDQLGRAGSTYSERKMRWLCRMKVKITKTTSTYISKSNLRSIM
jgi:hypothetical protein